MPSAEDAVPSSWADEVEEDDTPLTSGATRESRRGDIKTVTECRTNDEGRDIQVIRTYRIEKCKVSKSIAMRKTWKKFGMSEDDKPGPNAHTTVVGEEVTMVFITSKDEIDKQDVDDPFTKLKNSQKGTVKCRICKQDHWTTQCPNKDALGSFAESLKDDKDKKPDPSKVVAPAAPGKYVPPSRREGGNRTGESMMSGKEEQPTIRISNLSESTKDSDLQDLCKPFGRIVRIYLGKNRQTGSSRGFAYVTFQRREDAAKAIATLDHFGYDHLILKAEWSTTNKK